MGTAPAAQARGSQGANDDMLADGVPMFCAEGDVNGLVVVVVDSEVDVVEVGATVELVVDEAEVTNPNWLPVTTVTWAPSVTSLGS